MRALALLLALAACQAVPDVTYDSGGSAAVDGGNTCPGQVPPYASVCCGPIPCYGADCVATCQDCVSRCTLSDLCCPNAQFRATCRTNLVCP